jgi:hypothetical protein
LVIAIIQERAAVQTPKPPSFVEAAQALDGLKPGFDEALSVGGRLFRSTASPGYFESAGYGINYCFEYEDDKAPSRYENISQFVEHYQGRLRWHAQLEFNGKGLCVSFAPMEQFKAIHFRGETAEFVSAEDVAADARLLFQYLKERLTATAGGPASNVQTAREARLQDPDDPGVFEIYVLKNPEVGITANLHRDDRHLHFSPSDEQWKDLFSTIQTNPPNASASDSAQASNSGTGQFPLLSRISNPYDRGFYTFEELEALRTECEHAQRLVGSGEGRGAVEKILLAIDWAKQTHAGLLFNPSY